MSYPGSKAGAGVWQRIIGQMPPHRVYVEPFFGSGHVFKCKRRAEVSYLIEPLGKRANSAAVATVGVAAGVNMICGDALVWLPMLAESVPLDADALVYADPPYLLSTRQGRLYYKHEPERNDPEWHQKLLATLKALKCSVMLSGYPSDLYRLQLEDWRCITYTAMTHGGKKTECLWCNFPWPEQLHDWRYAGLNHRERYNLNRYVTRWLARVEKMPTRKRGFVLHALHEQMSQRQARREDIGAPTPSAALRSLTPAAALSAGHANGGVAFRK